MNADILVVIGAAALILLGLGRRGNRADAAQRTAQEHWDAYRPDYAAAFPTATEVPGPHPFQPKHPLDIALEVRRSVVGEERRVRFVVGPELASADLVGMSLPGWSFPLVIRLTTGSADELLFTAPGKWRDEDAIPIVRRLAALGVHNLGPLDGVQHTNVSVSGAEQFAERLSAILDAFAELQAIEPN